MTASPHDCKLSDWGFKPNHKIDCDFQHIMDLFVCIEALHPSQQFFSHVGMDPALPGFNQYCRE